MIRLTLILILLTPVLLHGQSDFSKNVAKDLELLKLPKKSWVDTTLGWSTNYQYHERKMIAKYYQCSGAYHLYEYVIGRVNNDVIQLDRKIYLDSNGYCYKSIDSLIKIKNQLTIQIDYSVVFDSSYNVQQINYRLPHILTSERLLSEAHENYIWEDIQYSNWLIQVRESMLSEGELPIQNFKLSPIAQAQNDSILKLMDIDGILTIKQKDSLEQIFVLNHKMEADSCDRFYQEGQITAIQKCRDCYTSLFEKYRYSHGEGSMLKELNHELQKLANEFAKLMAQADQAYIQENWEKALYYYQEALMIDNTSQYSINQIKKIKQLTKPKNH